MGQRGWAVLAVATAVIVVCFFLKLNEKRKQNAYRRAYDEIQRQYREELWKNFFPIFNYFLAEIKKAAGEDKDALVIIEQIARKRERIFLAKEIAGMRDLLSMLIIASIGFPKWHLAIILTQRFLDFSHPNAFIIHRNYGENEEGLSLVRKEAEREIMKMRIFLNISGETDMLNQEIMKLQQ